MEQPPPSAQTEPASRWANWLAWAEPISIAALFIFMLGCSWERWMDPVIDFPRNLYFAWRVSEGDLLYEKLANYYGPLAQLIEAAGFRLFGVSTQTLVWMNIALTAVVVLLLRAIFGAIGNRLSVWLCSVAFLTVFMVGHYSVVANANFITPYVSQATYGFAGMLLVLWGVLRHLQSERPFWMGVAGMGLAVAYLDKPESLLAGLGALGIYFLVQIIQRGKIISTAVAKGGASKWAGKMAGWLAGGFFLPWLAVFLFFLRQGGLVYAWMATNYVPHTLMSSSYRQVVLSSNFMLGMLGFDRPWQNFFTQLGEGFLLVLVCGGLAWTTRAWARAPQTGTRRSDWALATLVMGIFGAGLCAWGIKIEGNMGKAFVFPVILAALGYAYKSIQAARKGGEETTRLLGVTVVGMAAALMLARMILSGRITQFGFFMMPLAVMWIIHLMVVEAAKPAPGAERANILLPMMFSVVALSWMMALAWLNITNYAGENYLVGKDGDKFYTISPDFYPAGEAVNIMTTAFEKITPTAKTLVAFPEGIEVNYLLRVPTPLAELEFHPVALGYAGPDHVLEELRAHPPEAVFLFHRDLTEFNVEYFGQDEKSGRNIVDWLAEHYQVIWSLGSSNRTYTGHMIDLLVPKTAGQPGMPLLPAPGHEQPPVNGAPSSSP